MPRDGTGASDNAIEAGQNLVHGEPTGKQTTSEVDRSGKAAAMPEHEAGEAIPGMNASGGGEGIPRADGSKGPESK